jgi:hypothetical protein
MHEFPVMLEGGESMICLVTRIRFTKFSTFIWSIITYFRIRRRAMAVPGLFEMSIMIRGRNTLFFISLWEDVAAMAHFATSVRDLHPRAVHRVRQAGAEVWSGHFDLRGVAPNGERWANISSYLERR